MKKRKKVSARKQKLINKIISAKAIQRNLRKKEGQLNNKKENEEIKQDEFQRQKNVILKQWEQQNTILNEADDKLQKIVKNPRKLIDFEEYTETEGVEENIGKIWDIRDTIEDKIFRQGVKSVNGKTIKKDADKIAKDLEDMKRKAGSKSWFILQTDTKGNLTLKMIQEDNLPEHLQEELEETKEQLYADRKEKRKQNQSNRKIK